MVEIKVMKMGVQHLDDGEDEHFKSPGVLEAVYGASNTVKLVFIPEKSPQICLYAYIDRGEFSKIRDVLPET